VDRGQRQGEHRSGSRGREPSSHNRPVAKSAVDSDSTWFSNASRMGANAASSNSAPAASVFCRATIVSTPANCLGPMTAMRWLGHVKTNRGS
jgi:hypothetical protein